MTIRENLEHYEKEYLSPYATLSMNSRGRLRKEEACDIGLYSKETGIVLFTVSHFAD